jgi:hypothetical protein
MSSKRVKEKNVNNNILSPSHQLATETNINIFATAGCMFLRALCVSTTSERDKILILSSMDPFFDSVATDSADGERRKQLILLLLCSF